MSRFVIGQVEGDTGWMDRARCQGVRVEFFFPARGERTDSVKQFCAGCSVREECAEYALSNKIVHGFWGGLSERERRRIRRQRRGAA